MKAILTTFIFLLFVVFSMAQIPLVKKWDKRFGGLGAERTKSTPIYTSDGGYIVCGNSNSSNDGDKSQINWGSQSNIKSDFWIIKIDSMGNKVWDKRYGGTEVELLDFGIGSKDGSITLIGSSNSPVSGDIANINWTGSINDGGLWMIKLDSVGNKIWDKGYKLGLLDALTAAIATADGGYLISFGSRSGIGGLKTDTCRGDNDFFIVKLDSLGNKQWDKTYGGIGIDGPLDVIELRDGNFLIGGASSSSVGADKTDEVVGTLNSLDMWLIKIDDFGNKIWDKEFGGDNQDFITSIHQSIDGNYLLYGTSSSTPSGNKLAATKDTLSFAGDYWIVKVDSSGNKLWDKAFGGYNIEEDVYGNIVEDFDGGVIMSGFSLSDMGGDKSENNLLPYPNYQIWLIRIDSAGNKSWDKTMNLNYRFGGYSGYCKMLIAEPGCFLMQTSCNSDIIGDKSQLCWDTIGPAYEADYWVVKYCDTSIVTNTKKLQHVSLIMQAYPNPFASELFVQLSGKPNNVSATYSLLDVSGRLVLPTIESFATGTKFNTQKLLPGIYFLHAKTSKEHIVKKFVKF